MEMVGRLGRFMVVFSLLFNFWMGEALATCGVCGEGGGVAEAAVVDEQETFQAEVICLGCMLKKEQGGKAQCSDYGHSNALRTNDGKIWTILENDISTELIHSDDYTGEKVEITGRKFIDTQVVEIESFKVIEE